MSDDNISSAQLDQDEVDAQAVALLQSLRDNVENNVSVTRTFVHLRQEDTSMKAIPRRSRMQALVNEGRVNDITFSKRHTIDQMANLLATNIPTLAGVDPTRYLTKCLMVILRKLPNHTLAHILIKLSAVGYEINGMLRGSSFINRSDRTLSKKPTCIGLTFGVSMCGLQTL